MTSKTPFFDHVWPAFAIREHVGATHTLHLLQTSEEGSLTTGMVQRSVSICSSLAQSLSMIAKTSLLTLPQRHRRWSSAAAENDKDLLTAIEDQEKGKQVRSSALKTLCHKAKQQTA